MRLPFCPATERVVQLYCLEPLTTNGVNALVCPVIALISKARVADIARIRLLVCMHALVRCQGALLGKACITPREVAHKGLFIVVHTLVRNQDASVGEACITTREVARIRLFVCMNALVHTQVAICREAGITTREVTFERLLS